MLESLFETPAAVEDKGPDKSTALVTLIVMAMMLTAVLSWSQVSFTSMDSTAHSWREMADSAEEIYRTDIAITGANTTAPVVEVWIENVGRVDLASFDMWDVLIEYYDGNSTYHVALLEYTEDADRHFQSLFLKKKTDNPF